MKNRIYFLFLFIFVFAQLTAQTKQQKAGVKPNIILIYTDDLGYGDVGAYGTSAIPTPNIDRLAKNGVRFTNAHATSATCSPTRFSLLTGKYAWRKEGTGIAPGDAKGADWNGKITPGPLEIGFNYSFLILM